MNKDNFNKKKIKNKQTLILELKDTTTELKNSSDMNTGHLIVSSQRNKKKKE